MSMKEERKRAGFSQTALSRASGVPLRTIQHWDRGNAIDARAKNLVKVADVLGCSLDDLVGREVPGEGRR